MRRAQLAKFATTKATKELVISKSPGKLPRGLPADAYYPNILWSAAESTKGGEPFVDVEILRECLKLIGYAGSLRRDKVALQILCSGAVFL